MAQSTFDDDDLFTEASDEVKDNVREALEDARESLPDSDSLMEVEGDNIIGILNSLKSELDSIDIVDHVKEARKWFEMGRRADAFDDEFVDEVEEELNELQDIVEAVENAGESATELTDSIATLNRSL